MAKQEFLGNLRIARHLFAHPLVQTDIPQLDPKAIEQMTARAAIWLTPKSVAGFDAADFSELGPIRQTELEGAVRDFLAVAKLVPPNKPADPTQLGDATAAFSKILAILAPYVPSSGEGEKAEQVLAGVEFPAWVVNWDYELDNDSDGEPALWINLYVDESLAPRKEFARLASRTEENIRRALSAAGINRWPYARVRTALEHKTS